MCCDMVGLDPEKLPFLRVIMEAWDGGRHCSCKILSQQSRTEGLRKVEREVIVEVQETVNSMLLWINNACGGRIEDLDLL